MPTPRTDMAQYRKFSIQEFLLPSSMIKTRNPLFDRLLRRMRWPRGLAPEKLDTARAVEIRTAKIGGLKRYTRRYALLIPFAIAAVGAYLLFHDYNYQYSYNALLFFSIALLGSLGFSLLCDLYYAVTAINTMTQQAQQGQWDLLRLTKVSERDILLANYAMIQISAWRLAVIEIGLRFCLSAMLILGVIFISFEVNRNSIGNQYDPAFFLSLVVAFALMVGYMLEPIWRMRAVTLLGMTITTWLDGYATAIMTSFAALIGLLILQIIVLVASIWIFIPVLNWSSRYNLENYYFSYFWALFVITCLISIMYLFFKGMQQGIFRLLTRVAFRK